MKKTFLAIAIASLVSAAYATPPGNNGGGNGGCGVGQQTNGCSTGGAGGAGGQGGAGGTGVGVGVGIGIAGAAAGASASSDVKNTVNNAVVNSNSVRNETNNDVRNSNVGVNAQHQGQDQSQRQGQQQSNSSSNRNSVGATGSGNATSVSVVGDTVTYAAQERNPVATAYATPLTATNGTCMGSSSIGGQSSALGLSFGTTWKDDDCDRRYDANVLVSIGDRDVARVLMQQKKSVADAYAAHAASKNPPAPAGAPAGKSKSAATTLDGLMVNLAGNGGIVDAMAAAPQYTDPIIRARLGLPPLAK